MPVFMKYDGIQGTVKASSGGGVNALMADGSVRFIKDSINRSPGGGPRVTVLNGADRSAFNGGHRFTLTSHFDSVGAIEVSRIVFPNSPLAFDRVDALDGDAGGKAKMLFQAAANSAGGLIVSITKTAVREAANKMRHTNNLKQLGLAALNVLIPTLGFLVSDLGNSNPVAIELENTIISSYQSSGHGGDTHLMEMFQLNFTQVKVNYKNA